MVVVAVQPGAVQRARLDVQTVGVDGYLGAGLGQFGGEIAEAIALLARG